ncbi:MAG: hypothetical protein JW894_08320 [Bacteroidales bacterium]|nr:hypothetical protein [Bacteroidales bacterium]
MKNILLLILLVGILSSCSKIDNNGIYDQGRLEYKITYLNADEDNYDPSFLPKKMILEFNQDYSINLIDGFMGFFKLGNMTTFSSRKVKTHLKVLDKNYSFLGGRNEMMCCFDCMEGIQFDKDTATLNIAGLNSTRVLASFKGSPETFEIYYTNEINLSRPNASNPYHDIDGVLTKFRLIMGPYEMLFTATKFDPERTPKAEMDIPEEAILVNRNEMVAILNRLMEQNL